MTPRLCHRLYQCFIGRVKLLSASQCHPALRAQERSIDRGQPKISPGSGGLCLAGGRYGDLEGVVSFQERSRSRVLCALYSRCKSWICIIGCQKSKETIEYIFLTERLKGGPGPLFGSLPFPLLLLRRRPTVVPNAWIEDNA